MVLKLLKVILIFNAFMNRTNEKPSKKVIVGVVYSSYLCAKHIIKPIKNSGLITNKISLAILKTFNSNLFKFRNILNMNQHSFKQ